MNERTIRENIESGTTVNKEVKPFVHTIREEKLMKCERLFDEKKSPHLDWRYSEHVQLLSYTS